MKNLYKINKALVIINVVLGFTIYFGLLFLILLGGIQLIMSLIIASNRNQLNQDTTTLFSIYTLVTTTILIGILLIYFEVIPSIDGLIYFGIGASIIMAFLHLHITYLIREK